MVNCLWPESIMHCVQLLKLQWHDVHYSFNTFDCRYHQFKYEWQANKAPGEKSHKNLRWNVRVSNDLIISDLSVLNAWLLLIMYLYWQGLTESLVLSIHVKRTSLVLHFQRGISLGLKSIHGQFDCCVVLWLFHKPTYTDEYFGCLISSVHLIDLNTFRSQNINNNCWSLHFPGKNVAVWRVWG